MIKEIIAHYLAKAEAKNAVKENAADRSYEIKLISIQALAAAMGCISISMGLMPLSYIMALTCLILAFSISSSAAIWIMGTIFTTGISFLAFTFVFSMVRIFYYDVPFTFEETMMYFKNSFFQLLSVCIILKTTIGLLFSYIGCLDELCDYKNSQ